MDIEKLKFPIGKYSPNKNPNKEQLNEWIAAIENFPKKINDLVENVSIEQLNYKYRPNGWTVKQVIHHCTDSHMNSIIRFKLALTEDKPIIRPYHEDKWAELNDSQDNDLESSIMLLNGLHKKWSSLLKSLNKDQLKLEYSHPEHGTIFNLVETIGNYAWHCNHHLAHVKNGINTSGLFNN